MKVNNIPITINTYNGLKSLSKDIYICEKEVPCMMVEYIHCHEHGIISIVIRRSYETYYNESKWIQHKQIKRCLDCEKEKKYADSIGPPKVHYIDPQIIKVMRKYLIESRSYSENVNHSEI